MLAVVSTGSWLLGLSDNSFNTVRFEDAPSHSMIDTLNSYVAKAFSVNITNSCRIPEVIEPLLENMAQSSQTQMLGHATEIGAHRMLSELLLHNSIINIMQDFKLTLRDTVPTYSSTFQVPCNLHLYLVKT